MEKRGSKIRTKTEECGSSLCSLFTRIAVSFLFLLDFFTHRPTVVISHDVDMDTPTSYTEQAARRKMDEYEKELAINPWSTVHLDRKGRVLAILFGDVPKVSSPKGSSNLLF